MSAIDIVYVRTGRHFENEVAAAYRALGATVEQLVPVAGTQLDLMVTEETPSGNPLSLGVECKSYNQPLDANAVYSFGAVAKMLIERRFIHRGVIVSASGFTKRALAVGQEQGIELLRLKDLVALREGENAKTNRSQLQIRPNEKILSRQPSSKRLFVAMPFSKDFRDVYVFGIRQLCEKLGLVAERGDEIEHNGGILEVVQERIRGCDALVAEISSDNPNVFYEIGYSHALARPTILISKRSGPEIPVDLRTVNYIQYETAEDLQYSLEKRLRATLLIS